MRELGWERLETVCSLSSVNTHKKKKKFYAWSLRPYYVHTNGLIKAQTIDGAYCFIRLYSLNLTLHKKKKKWVIHESNSSHRLRMGDEIPTGHCRYIHKKKKTISPFSKKKKKIVLFLSYSYGYICELATQTPKKGILKRHYLTNLRFKILFGDPLS